MRHRNQFNVPENLRNCFPSLSQRVGVCITAGIVAAIDGDESRLQVRDMSSLHYST